MGCFFLFTQENSREKQGLGVTIMGAVAVLAIIKQLLEKYSKIRRRKVNAMSSVIYKVEKDVVAGSVYDLQGIYNHLNEKYFEGSLSLSIDWFGRTTSSGRIQRKVLGYYDARYKRIRIHVSLNHSFFPPYFLSYVVYHEMVHSVAPPIKGGVRRRVHHGEFKKRERCFEDYSIAKQWEQENLDKILYGRDRYGRT